MARMAKPVHNVVIVGGGQTGLGIAFGLQRERISGVVMLDTNAPGEEGPWVTFARMITLRTLKFLTGPDLGLPSLTFRTWHEAQYGKQSWEDLVRIPKDEWMRYLVWFRDTLHLPVRNNVRLERIEPRGDLLALHLRTPAGPDTMLTRKLVLATGIEGAGVRRVPGFVRDNLPREYLGAYLGRDRFFQPGRPPRRGHRRRCLGVRQRRNGAGAWRGMAGCVHPPARSCRWQIPTVPWNPAASGAISATCRMRIAGASCATCCRCRCRRRRTRCNARCIMPMWRCILPRRCWMPETVDGGIRLRTPQAWHAADFLILGTGFAVDLRARPEFAGLAEHVALWGDRYTPPPEEADPAAARYPYVGPHFELLEKQPGSLPALRNVHLFNAGSLVSMGPVAGGLNGMPFGIPRLIAGISHDLFRAELDSLFTEFASYEEPDAWEAVRAGGAGGG